MIYPFVVSFIIGIVFENFFHFGWSVALLVGLVSVIIFLVSRFTKIFLVIGLTLILGILRMTLIDISPDPNLLKSVGQKISFEADIIEEPDVRDTSTRYTVNPLNSKSVMLLVADRFPKFQYGDKIKIFGKLDLPKNFASDNGTEFDYISYLSKDKIHFLIYHPHIEKVGGGGNKIISSLYSFKNILIKNIEAVVPEPNASLLNGVIFGTKQSLGQELLADFKKVGLMHIVVLSGYNITIIAIGIFYLTSFLNKRNLSFILSVIFIILFALMVGLGATVIRACIMSLIALLARFLGRPADALRWLFIAGFLMLLWNPLILFSDPSFQLSFMATLGLILFSPFIENFILRSKLQKFITNKFKLREIIASTLAVQFFVLPLLIKMSGFISLISFIVNPLILPFVPWAMASGALTGVLGIISSFFGQILSWPSGIIAYFISQIIITVTEFSADIPFAIFQVGIIPLWLIFVWYLGYAILLARLSAQK